MRRSEDLRGFEAIFKAIFAASNGVDRPERPAPFSRDGAGSRGDLRVPVPLSHGSDDIGGGLPWTTLPDVLAEAQMATKTSP